MLQHDAALFEALGAGGAHIVALQRLEHGAARVAHDHAGDGVAEHEGRHDRRRKALAPILPRADIARRRQPAERHGEEEDQHDAEPEVRRRDAPQRQHVDGVVDPGVALDRRDDAGGDADQERDRHRHDGELERHRQLLQDQLHHRLLQPHRLAEVAGEHALDPVQVLDRDRLIEAVLAPDLLDHRRVALLARHDQRRIAGQELLQREDDHRHEEQRRQKLHEPAADEGEHPHLSPCGRGRVGEADRVRGETPMPVIHLPPCGGGRVGEADRVRGKTPMPGHLRYASHSSPSLVATACRTPTGFSNTSLFQKRRTTKSRERSQASRSAS